jgi:hypothetical protein
LLSAARKDAEALAGTALGEQLAAAVEATERATEDLLGALGDRVADALAGATVYTTMLGTTLGGWFLARSVLAADDGDGFDREFLEAKRATAGFYADHHLSTVPGMLHSVIAGAATTFGVPEEALDR